MRVRLGQARAGLLAALLLMPAAVLAQPAPETPAETPPETPPEELGDLNPDELTWQRVMRDTERGETSMMNCAMGYMITKSGRHVPARELFERCAADGWTGAMTWMSQLDENGLGAPRDSARAAEWDRRAAEAGDPVGQFNHGLGLLRGHGTRYDPEAGRRMIDSAAEAGLPVARRLQEAGYDPRAVTPDADEGRFEPMF